MIKISLLALLASVALAQSPATPSDAFAACGGVYSASAGIACTVGLQVSGATYATATLVATGKGLKQKSIFADIAYKVASHGPAGLWLTGGGTLPTTQQITSGGVTFGSFVSVLSKNGIFAFAGPKIIVPMGAPKTAYGVQVETQLFCEIGMRFGKMKSKVIHRGDAGRGAILCGAREKIEVLWGERIRNWAWKPEEVTCKRCIAIYKRELAERFGR